FFINRWRGNRNDMKDHSWIAPREMINDGKNDSLRLSRCCSDAHFAHLWIAEGLDLLDTLREFVKDDRASSEERATILRGLNTLRATVEKSHPYRMFQVSNGSGDGGLGGVQDSGGLAHAASFHDSQQNLEVVQLYPASDSIARLHLWVSQ